MSGRYRGQLKLPGYFELHPEGALSGETSSLLELGREFNRLGDQFYGFSESLFKETWQGDQVFWANSIDKFRDFFTYCRALSQNQVSKGLKAVEEYRKEMGYYTRMTTAGRNEWALARDLQTAISNQLGRWVSLREMGIMFRGRDILGNPNDDSFFTRRMQGNKQKFRKDSIGDLLLWIANPINWESKSISYTIQLNGDNYNLAKQSILLYNARVYNNKNVYIVDEDATNTKSLRIITTLLLAYSDHPWINTNFGKKGIAFRPLFEHLGAYNWRIFRTGFKEELSVRQARHLLFKAHEDALHLHNSRGFLVLCRQIRDLHPYWWYTTFGIGNLDTYIMKDMILYHRTYEQKMENYYKLALIDPILTLPYSNNRYYNGFLAAPGQPVDSFLKKQQARILIRQWGGRSPTNGRKINTDSHGYPKESITAHHYEYAAINPLNYYDCRISALVPIPDAEHLPSGTPHTLLWYNRFRLSKEAIAMGRIPVPMWWSRANRLAYIRELNAKGLRNFILLIPASP
ncbi:MAG: hypothetical protein ACFFE4_21255 [Candidatus Thorarchaeota archaeon]